MIPRYEYETVQYVVKETVEDGEFRQEKKDKMTGVTTFRSRGLSPHEESIFKRVIETMNERKELENE